MVIGAWGDSITYGGGDEAALGWVGRLRKELNKGDCEVYNRGVCSDTSAEVLERFDIEADSIEPDVIILAVGINDSKFPDGGRENAVPLDAFQNNVERLTNAALSRTRSVIIIGLTEVNEQKITGTSSVFQNESIAAYNNRLRATAKAKVSLLLRWRACWMLALISKMASIRTRKDMKRCSVQSCRLLSESSISVLTEFSLTQRVYGYRV